MYLDTMGDDNSLNSLNDLYCLLSAMISFPAFILYNAEITHTAETISKKMITSFFLNLFNMEYLIEGVNVFDNT